MNTRPILRKHKLAHIAELRVAEDILRTRFAAHCSMGNCRGTCCSDGVDLDPSARDKILNYADRVRSEMDESQQHDPANWFTDEFEDEDFPSRRAASTRTHNGACVFLNKQGRCVLQLIESQAGSEVGILKPFFCTAYPICISSGLLTIDDEECAGQFQCCSAAQGGSLSIFDICAFELEYVLGKDGANELRALTDSEESA